MKSLTIKLTMYAGLTGDRKHFLRAAAVIIILFSITRILLEIFQLLQLRHLFFADFANWVEMPLFILTIIFASVFHSECLCPQEWQWQAGILALFLAWADFILYMRKMRVMGKKSA